MCLPPATLRPYTLEQPPDPAVPNGHQRPASRPKLTASDRSSQRLAHTHPTHTHPNAAVVVSFFSSLRDSDFERLRQCYAPDVVYSDPVFHELRGPRALAMWEMFCRRGGLGVEFGDVVADDATGAARWEASYEFSATGRPVHNIIRSRFRFAGGLIAEHHDTFDVRRWASMALGTTGRLLGWAPPMRAVLHRRSVQVLDTFVAARDAEKP